MCNSFTGDEMQLKVVFSPVAYTLYNALCFHTDLLCYLWLEDNKIMRSCLILV